MKNLFLIVLTLSLTLPVIAQNERSNVVFKAMQDELSRVGDLKIGSEPSPFYVAYYLSDAKNLALRSSLGTILNENTPPTSSILGINVNIGNYQKNSELDFSGIIRAQPVTFDNNYMSLRTSIWNQTDAAYKMTVRLFQAKNAVLTQMQLSPEVLAVHDCMKLKGGINIVEREVVNVDKEKWEESINTLSKRFLNYPKLTNTYVSYLNYNKVYYMANTEGAILEYPEQLANLIIHAEIQDNNGEVHRDDIIIYGCEDSDFPSIENLVEQVDNFAQKLSNIYDVPSIDSYYSGPVMYVDRAVTSIFNYSLLSITEGLLNMKTISPTEGWQFNSLERRLNEKIIDKKLSIKNYTDLKEYNGKKLIGSYSIDADGVVPEKEMSLVENGVLLSLLSNRYPTLKSNKSTGSNRYNITNGSAIQMNIAPGVLHISSNDSKKYLSMKKTLMKMAKKEDLEYTYIVYSPTLIYKVDVKTGKENRVKSASFKGVDISMIANVPVISKEENIVNMAAGGGVPITLITPKAIILNGVNINQSNASKVALPIITNPLLRIESKTIIGHK